MRSLSILCAAALLCQLPLCGDQLTGEIRLEVKDPSGAPMEAAGKLSGAAGRTFRTDPGGAYIFRNLPVGNYRLEISRNGFATQSLPVEVRAGTPILRTVTMALSTAAVQVEVVGTTPLPGSDLTLLQIPAPVQIASQHDIEASGALDLSDFLNRRLNGVHLNDVQNNPFQADLNYRGYSASPLLGTPEGVSVYMDGVRLNQPFGDVVSWDLIPRIAIAEAALMPGSNPVYGLNTLGGALSVQTKDGHGHPGASIQATIGSFGRRAVELEYGGSNARGFNWYLAGNLFHDDGWRDYSPSDVRQSFARLGWQAGKTSLGLTAAYADNELTGNGLHDHRLLARDYSSIYTQPDITNNRSPFFNLSARHTPSAAISISGNAYFRYIRADTYNADLNEGSLDESVYQLSAADIAALTAAGYSGFPTSGANAANTPFPKWRCIAQALQRDEPVEKCNGILTHTFTKQNNYGGSAQMTWIARHNQLSAGTAYDRSSVGFQQFQQFAYLNPDLGFTPVDGFADGSTSFNGAPYDTRVNLHGRIHTWSLYATDTLSIGKTWNFTLSGRYNRTTLDNRDRITPGGLPGSLDSHNIFGRFNPGAGVTFNPSRWVNAYLSYSEGSRAPTSIELGCADPNQPCKLPNAMAGDPPLQQVVTRTWEAGLRGGHEMKVGWSAGFFQSQNRNDILFVASEQTGYGYFKNFGRTRRQGLEVDVNSRIRGLTFGGGYTFLDATYRSAETVDGSSNSSNDAAAAGVKGVDGAIRIQPGDRIPLLPRHMLKGFGDLRATSKLSFDLDLVAISSSIARGNENNLYQSDGRYYTGPGAAPGYAVVNLGARYQLQRRLQLFAQLNNLFDRRYYTAAQLGPTGFTDQGTFIARPFPAVNGEFGVQHATFFSPGAPRTVWGGFRFRF